MTPVVPTAAPRDLGTVLLRLLPQLYRARDGAGTAAAPAPGAPERGDLERLLAACGGLLDEIHATLEQRLADCFPDAPPDGMRASQSWLLPYFARLVDARPRSPHVAGRRREVAEAIGWRQRKGTLGAVEAIAEATLGREVSGLGGREVELREGFRLVATTAHVDRLDAADPAEASIAAPATGPLAGARLPGTTVAVDLPARAVRVPPDVPGARRSSFGRNATWSWAVLHPTGVPCFPGHFDDLSRRTVDVRDPGPRGGHAHPRRLLLHVAPPLGFFAPGHSSRRGAPEGTALTDEVAADAATVELRDRRIGTLTLGSAPLTLTGCTVERVEGEDAGAVLVAQGSRLGTVSSGGPVRLRACTVTGPVRAPALSARDSLLYSESAAAAEPLVGTGRVRLRRCAVESVVADAEDVVPLRLRAASCLIGELSVAGAAQLEYCTVLGASRFETLAASDCLLAGVLELTGPADALGCVRYSRIPPSRPPLAGLRTHAVTSATPVFADVDGFAAPGSGVLDPATPPAIRHGAEDGGELGAYHDLAHSLEEQAMADQVEDHLPHGLRPVLVPDERLHEVPPALRGLPDTGEDS
jgi:hypothetical protein